MSFKSVFLFVSIVVVLASVVAGIFIWQQAKGVRGLNITLELPEEIIIGAPFDLEVGIANESDNILEDAELSVELPADVVFLGSPADKTIDFKILGNLGQGSLTQESFRLLATGGENTVKEIKVTVNYLPSSLGSKFEKTQSVAFSVVGAGTEFDIAVPQKVFSGEEFDAVVTYKNTSGGDLTGLRLKISYPPVFAFKSASLAPDFGNNVWELGDLRDNSAGKITIKGQLVGPDDAFFEFKTSLDAEFQGRNYTIAERTASIAIEPSPITIQIALNGSQDYVAYADEDLRYTINFLNNTDVALNDVIVRAKLAGEMFDLSSVASNASLRSSDNTLIWNTANTQGLSVLAPGANSAVSFSLKTKDSYPIKRLSDKNFMLKVEVQVESPTVPYNVASEKTLAVAKMETKVGGQLLVDAQGFFRDAASGIVNKGPWPPKVGQPTNFTIHWFLYNYSTDVSNVELKAFLGSNVKVTLIKSNIASAPAYNDRTQEIAWNIDRIQATKGVLTSPVEAVFQVELTPAVNQAGSGATLMQTTLLTVTDDFTGASLRSQDAPVTTDNLNDPTVSASQGVIQ